MSYFYDKMQLGELMKVLTIKQPFATLIAEGYKEYEFRTWKTKFRGEFLIHAGKSVDKKAMERFKHLNLDYPTGCILASVNLVDCVYVDEEMADILAKKDPLVYYGIIHKKEWDGYGFQLSNIRKIKPIFINGKLSFWEYEGEIEWNE